MALGGKFGRVKTCLVYLTVRVYGERSRRKYGFVTMEFVNLGNKEQEIKRHNTKLQSISIRLTIFLGAPRV